jgi:hypothetical protein
MQHLTKLVQLQKFSTATLHYKKKYTAALHITVYPNTELGTKLGKANTKSGLNLVQHQPNNENTCCTWRANMHACMLHAYTAKARITHPLHCPSARRYHTNNIHKQTHAWCRHACNMHACWIWHSSTAVLSVLFCEPAFCTLINFWKFCTCAKKEFCALNFILNS